MTNPLQGSDEETQERITGIRARLSAATPGPWWVGNAIGPSDSDDAIDTTQIPINGCDHGVIMHDAVWVPTTPDLDFIASAPTDLAFLLSRVDSLESALREAQKDVERLDWLTRCDFLLAGYDNIGSAILAHRESSCDLREAIDAVHADTGGAVSNDR